MGHGKETPRQKMIGMMYLVLTALLALNVSKDVLNAFILVNAGLTKTTQNFFEKNEALYGDFDEAYQGNKVKVQDWKLKADEVRKRSQELNDLLFEYKKEIVLKAEGPETPAIHDNEVDLFLVNQKDNNNIPGEVMIVNKKGLELKNKIIEFREYLLSLIEDKETYASVVKSIESSLNTEDPKPVKPGEEAPSWESENFEHLPLASVITMLSKMQSDVRNSESESVGFLLSQIDAGSFKFNKIDPVVISTSGDYIFKGQEYIAQVFLAAYDSTKFPTVVLDNNTELPVENGKGVYKSTASTIGLKKWGGTIILDQGNGSIIKRDFDAEYQVAEASAVISPTKMNVFYRSVKNPVSISVSGVPEENLQATISKGSIVREGGAWVVQPVNGPEDEIVTVKVAAKFDNVVRPMGEMKFRVKDVPDPLAEVSGRSQGVISLGDLTKGGGSVTAKLKNFLFDLEFNITEFTVSAVLSGGLTKTETSSGSKFTRPQLEIVSQLRTGQRITFENIKAVGPDGKIRTLNSIVLKII